MTELSPEQKAKVEHVRGIIANELAKYFDAGREWGKNPAKKPLVSQIESDARKLLSLKDSKGNPMVGIIDDDQEEPIGPYTPDSIRDDEAAFASTYEQGQRSMLAANFKKIIIYPEEG